MISNFFEDTHVIDKVKDITTSNISLYEHKHKPLFVSEINESEYDKCKLLGLGAFRCCIEVRKSNNN